MRPARHDVAHAGIVLHALDLFLRGQCRRHSFQRSPFLQIQLVPAVKTKSPLVLLMSRIGLEKRFASQCSRRLGDGVDSSRTGHAICNIYQNRLGISIFRRVYYLRSSRFRASFIYNVLLGTAASQCSQRHHQYYLFRFHKFICCHIYNHPPLPLRCGRTIIDTVLLNAIPPAAVSPPTWLPPPTALILIFIDPHLVGCRKSLPLFI